MIYSKSILEHLHEAKDSFYMILDDRYFMPEIDYDRNSPEFRLAISYGQNLTIDMNEEGALAIYDGVTGEFIDSYLCKPFNAPPRQDGKFVYGVHTVIVNPINNNVWIADRWVTSYAAKEPHLGVFDTGYRLLQKINDKKYSQLCQGIVCSDNSHSKFLRPGGDLSQMHSTKYEICCSVNPDKSERVKIRPVFNHTLTDHLWFEGVDFASFMNHMSLSHQN